MQASPTTNVTVTIIIEGSLGDNNYSAYISELRLGAMGDTEVEAMENVIDLARMERDRLLRLAKVNVPIIVKVNLAV